VLQKSPSFVPIPGTKRRTYLEENVAADTVRLTPAEMATLDAALAPGKVRGERYQPRVMETIDR
jgi:aryl-alcohol dehydrogenase-like predicted oxidoreductase